MATSVLSRKKGVIVGDDVLNLFKYAQEKKFAIPAIVCFLQRPPKYNESAHKEQNVTSSSTVVASLEAARDKKAPIILQMSQGGAAYFAGKVRMFGLPASGSTADTEPRGLPMETSKLPSPERSQVPIIFAQSLHPTVFQSSCTLTIAPRSCYPG